MKSNGLLLGLALAGVLVTAQSSQASYIFPWTAQPQITDPTEFVLLGSRDITGIWVGSDTGYYYFRMDLNAAPSFSGTNFAGIYGIYIDAIPNAGASYTTTNYVPINLTGIDYILDSHFAYAGHTTFSSVGNHFHYGYTVPDGFQVGSYDGFQATENGGKTLEWKVAKSKLGDPATFTIWGATLDDGSANATYDVAPDTASAGYPVPEPTTLALAGVAAAVGLGFVLRRR